MGCWLFIPGLGSDLHVLPPFSSVSSFIEVPGEEISFPIVLSLVRIDRELLLKC
jgi:hypothetical protein